MRSFLMSKTVIRNLLSGPATLMYPKKARAFTAITRGRVEIDIDTCIHCGLCSRRCPTYAITVTKDSREWQIDRLKCCTCNLCVEICPVKCLSMKDRYSPPVSGKNEALYTARPDEAAAPTPAQDLKGNGA